MIATVLLSVSLMTAACLPLTAYAESAAESLHAGIEAFRDNQLRRARSFFLQALSGGLQSGKLYYNLGVVHYRLAEYTDARQFFVLAAEYPGYQQVAHYNLARCAVKLEQHEVAKGWYSRAAEGKDQRIADLALRARQQVQPRREPAVTARLSWAGGFDSSVVGLVDQVTSDPTDAADIFYELSAQVRGDVPLSVWPLMQAGVSLYALEYDSVEQAGLKSLAVDVLGGDTLNLSQLRWGLYLGHEWLGSDAFQLRSGLRGQWLHAWKGFWFKHGISLEIIRAQSQMAAGVEGLRMDLGSAVYRKLGGGVMLARLNAQINRRELRTNSPRRLGLDLFWRSSRPQGWRLGPGLQWRFSDFSGARDQEMRVRGLLRLEEDLQSNWSSRLEFQLERNWTDDPRFRYDHFRVLLGLNWQS